MASGVLLFKNIYLWVINIIVMKLRGIWWFLIDFLRKYGWFILIATLLVIFLIPLVKIYCGADPDDMCMFGLDNLKDFFTLWISLFGVVGIAINVIHSQIRIRLQDKLIHQQEKQGRDNRFAKSVELLGHESESARMGGVYNLRFLAEEFFNEYGDCVFSILSSHVRVITSTPDYQSRYKEKPSDEIQSILGILTHFSCFIRSHVNLMNSYLAGADLERVDLSGANLRGVNFRGANLEKVDLRGANLVLVDFMDANLRDVYLTRANLTGVYFRGAKLQGVHVSEDQKLDIVISGGVLED